MCIHNDPRSNTKCIAEHNVRGLPGDTIQREHIVHCLRQFAAEYFDEPLACPLDVLGLVAEEAGALDVPLELLLRRPGVIGCGAVLAEQVLGHAVDFFEAGHAVPHLFQARPAQVPDPFPLGLVPDVRRAAAGQDDPADGLRDRHDLVDAHPALVAVHALAAAHGPEYPELAGLDLVLGEALGVEGGDELVGLADELEHLALLFPRQGADGRHELADGVGFAEAVVHLPARGILRDIQLEDGERLGDEPVAGDAAHGLDQGVQGWGIALADDEYFVHPGLVDAEVLEAVRSAARTFEVLGARVDAVPFIGAHEAALANGVMTTSDAQAPLLRIQGLKIFIESDHSVPRPKEGDYVG